MVPSTLPCHLTVKVAGVVRLVSVVQDGDGAAAKEPVTAAPVISSTGSEGVGGNHIPATLLGHPDESLISRFVID